MAFDPRIDDYIARSADFAQPVLVHLRELVHAAEPQAVETIKWGFPHFTLDGRILAGMAAFKAHCTFGFWQREAVDDKSKTREAMGQFGRITGLGDLPARRELLAQIKTAARLIREGAPARAKDARRAPKPPPEAPPDLLHALAANDEARRTFEAFPPSKQRDYVDWITEAKQEATRLKRLLQAVEWLAEGKSRHWKYENC